MTIAIHFIRYWLPVVVLCSAIFIQSSFASPDTLLPRFPFSDKLLHLLVYGFLAALVCRAVNSHDGWQCRWRRLFFIGVVATSLYGLSDEWHQSFVAERCAEAADLLADFAGSIVGSGCFLLGARRFSRRD